MSAIARLALVVLMALSIATPAAARQPVGIAGWTTDGFVAFDATLRSGPGKQYDPVGTIEADIRIRVDRCTQRWCQVRTASVRGWLPIDQVSFGQAPGGWFRGPAFGFKSGGSVCFYEGANFTGRSFCADAGRVIKDMALIGRDNAIRSIRVNGSSALVCRDFNFRSYCERINEDKRQLTGFLNRSISSIRVY